MRRGKDVNAIKDNIAEALHRAWVEGFTSAVASRGPGGIMGAAAQPWDSLCPQVRQRYSDAADGLVNDIATEGCVLVPSRVVAIIEALAAAIPPGEVQSTDSRVILARAAEMLEAVRADLATFKGKEPCRSESRSTAATKSSEPFSSIGAH